MVGITRHGNGWRAQVARRGERRSKAFATTRGAQDWAVRQEHLIMNASVIAADQAFGMLLDRDAQEVSPTKRGERWEVVRPKRLGRDDLAKVRLSALPPSASRTGATAGCLTWRRCRSTANCHCGALCASSRAVNWGCCNRTRCGTSAARRTLNRATACQRMMR